MPKIDVYDPSKKSVGTVDLPDAVFAAPVKKQLLWEVVRSQQATLRAGTASTKKRGDVSGGGKKPWKQKHTGNARHGSTREPQWRHGGNIFGPTPRDYSYEIPRKMRKAAMTSALSQRLKEGKLVVLDKVEWSKPSTKQAAAALEKLGLTGTSLVIVPAEDANVEKSFRNLKNVKVLPVAGLNVRDVLRHENLVLFKGALEGVAKRATV